MSLSFLPYHPENLSEMTTLWNEVLVDGVAFPGTETFSDKTFEKYLFEQSAVTCMFMENQFAGFYILHPNNIGRCSHIANASYCIAKTFRGKRIFDPLVRQSLLEAKRLGFSGMQFNAVVASNLAAIRTYRKNGFDIIGTIHNGFRLKNERYSDMYIMYKELC